MHKLSKTKDHILINNVKAFHFGILSHNKY